MKVVILAGGIGSRLSEETTNIPKPLVKIGEKPIIWHIMKHYSYYGFKEFIICGGYKVDLLKEYFYNFKLHNYDFSINTRSDKKFFDDIPGENWSVTICNTGIRNGTASRILQIKKHLPKNEPFMLTYGDGVSNVNLKQLLSFHKTHGKIGTVTSIQPKSKFGSLTLDESRVNQFDEKIVQKDIWINGGYFVFNYDLFDYISNKNSLMLEESPIQKLIKENNLFTYKHNGFWHCMDTIKDKGVLTNLWDSNNAAWKVWN